jgi:lysophospholipase L1-like esterase
MVLAALSLFGQGGFLLKDGDRVVFYGDSITDQRLYTTFAETFVRTRYPNLKIAFTHSGWGGDKVGGGAGGPIDMRLARDVFPYNPTVVTIMLGMNDGRYRPFDAPIFKMYADGYDALVRSLKQQLPGVRITAIRPSPFDEVTREPMQGGGYNPVMVRFGDYVQELAMREKMLVADLNAPVVRMLERANAMNPPDAQKIIADRVHPGSAGHLIMAGALVKAWNAAAIVSAVELDAASGSPATMRGAAVSDVRSAGGGLSWTQTDEALPMPLDLEDGVMRLAIESSDFVETLNQQPLKVMGLKPGHYALLIDGQQVAVFTNEALAAGVNLAMMHTPMTRQAARVHDLVLKRTNVHNVRWRTIEVPMADDSFLQASPAMRALDALDADIDARLREESKPKARRFEVIPVPASMASVPAGFTPIFNGKDLSGWHVSSTNHHGTAPDWKVEDGAITGMQNPPGKGGILLTDRKYRNFEVYVELKPDWGNDGGLFLRSSEKGQAYQVMLDYREGGNVGGVYGEALKGVIATPSKDWEKAWKRDDWNTIRARITGDLPRIQVWINGVQVTDFADMANHSADGALGGMIAVQVHGGTKIWKEGGKHRFRVIAVKELP